VERKEKYEKNHHRHYPIAVFNFVFRVGAYGEFKNMAITVYCRRTSHTLFRSFVLCLCLPNEHHDATSAGCLQKVENPTDKISHLDGIAGSPMDHACDHSLIHGIREKDFS